LKLFCPCLLIDVGLRVSWRGLKRLVAAFSTKKVECE